MNVKWVQMGDAVIARHGLFGLAVEVVPGGYFWDVTLLAEGRTVGEGLASSVETAQERAGEYVREMLGRASVCN